MSHSYGSISKTSFNTENTTRPFFLETINGTKNKRMHGKKAKDDSKWVWDGREGRYIYCVRDAVKKCEELQYTKQCFGQNLPYQSTSLDLTNYYSQDQSLEKLISYQALKYIPKCWSAIQPFLCAVFFPKCENINGVDMVYLPSYEMCKITMEPCKILYNSSYFPDFLKCNETIFPSKCNNDVREMKFNISGECLSPLVDVEDISNSYKDIEGCGIECKDPLYTEDEHRQIRKLVGWGASICLALHIFAIFTFTIDWHNGNKYPALIIFYVNLCYMISCIGWLAQFVPGARHDIVCRFDNTLKKGEPSGGENLSCIIVFILVYYFLMAAMCWFVIFTYAWHVSFKAIGKIQERIDKKASYFHLIAWSIPLVLTIAILAISEVDGNSIVGICFVGYFNHAIRGGFVLGPLICSSLIGGYFLIRGMLILINLKISSKQIISTKASKKIRQSIIRMGICSALTFIFICVTVLCHIYEFQNSRSWAESLRNLIICKITSAYSDDDSTSCKLFNRPSIALLQLHLMSNFAAGIVMASFVFTPSTVETWGRYFKRKFGPNTEEPLKLQKHKVIAQAFAKRKEFQNRGRLSISFHNSHTDPVGLKFDMNSAIGSQDFSSTWANNLPRFVHRRYALTGCPSSSTSHGHRRNSVDSVSFVNVRHVSVESRRNSNDSQVSVKIAELSTKVSSRSRGSKAKSRSSSRQQRRDFTSRRYSRKESSTSVESQIVAMKPAQNTTSTMSTAEAVALVPLRYNGTRRSGLAAMDPHQINELIAKNKCLLPFLTTSDDDKSSVASFNMQDSKLDVILKQIGLSEHKIIENNIGVDNRIHDVELIEMKNRRNSDLDDNSSGKENYSNSGRLSKTSNRSISSKKSLKTSSMRLKKSRRSSRSITKTANPLASNSGRLKIDRKSEKMRDKMRGSHGDSFMHGSYSGRSDVGIQTENPSDMSSNEFAERLLKQDRMDAEEEEEEEQLESNRLLAKRTSLGAQSKRRSTNENLLTESEKLKFLLLPSN